MRALPAGLLVTVVACVAGGCAVPVCSEKTPTSGGTHTCAMPQWRNRDYLLHLPAGFDGSRPLPVLIFFHGGGGKKEGALKSTCPGGDTRADRCLDHLADREGFILVIPDGTAQVGDFIRTWNAGGGNGEQKCCCGKACDDAVDDVQYVRDLLDELQRYLPVDTHRVFTTGMSNGAAMSHRLACQLSDRIAAVAPVGGANQFATAGDCNPGRAVPVLHIHGSDDPCWPYEGGEEKCFNDRNHKGKFVSVVESLKGANGHDGWVQRHGCNPTPVVQSLPDTSNDGCTSTREDFQGCGADVSFITVQGGGHVWPDGDQYLGINRVGRRTSDFNGNEVIWEFLRNHPMP